MSYRNRQTARKTVTGRTVQTARKNTGGLPPRLNLITRPPRADIYNRWLQENDNAQKKEKELTEKEKLELKRKQEQEMEERCRKQEQRVKDLVKALAEFDQEEKRKKIARAEAYKKMAEEFEKNYTP